MNEFAKKREYLLVPSAQRIAQDTQEFRGQFKVQSYAGLVFPFSVREEIINVQPPYLFRLYTNLEKLNPKGH